MGYEEKLNAIEDELENMTLEDYPEDIIDSLQEEAEDEHREFLEEKLAEDMERFDWNESGDGESNAREILRDRLIAERFSDEEKAEYRAYLHAEEIMHAQKRLAEAQADLDKNAAAIAEAKERNKPKMLAHEEDLRRRRIEQLDHARRELESLVAGVSPTDAKAAVSQAGSFSDQLNADIEELLGRLAKANGNINPDSAEMGHASGQLSLLVQKIVEHDKTSDLSGYVALPGLLYKICGPNKKAVDAAA
jgi:hypothetical protein